jgi:2-keto-3-deoxy-L-rhamnonate aldolase RhmA
MSVRLILALVALTLVTGPVVAQGPGPKRVNRVVELLQQKKPVFGLYAPSNRRMRPGGPGAAAPAPEAPAKSPAELAKEALGYQGSDFVFDGSMEGGLERALPAFTDFVKGMQAAGTTPAVRHAHPLIVKTPEMDAPTIAADIGTQLNLGVSGLMFPKAESAEQVRKGIAAMRFASKGGTRAETVGTAPAYWGLSEQDYKKKADVWPLNPEGELINWTIIESKEGLARVREIAAVKGIGVLWPGAGTLRGIFSKTNEKGERVLDEPAWEAAIQQVLSACKEFNVPCGFPANANDIELRMKQGFSVFVMNWGDAGFKTIDIGRRTATSTASK